MDWGPFSKDLYSDSGSAFAAPSIATSATESFMMTQLASLPLVRLWRGQCAAGWVHCEQRDLPHCSETLVGASLERVQTIERSKVGALLVIRARAFDARVQSAVADETEGRQIDSRSGMCALWQSMGDALGTSRLRLVHSLIPASTLHECF